MAPAGNGRAASMALIADDDWTASKDFVRLPEEHNRPAHRTGGLILNRAARYLLFRPTKNLRPVVPRVSVASPRVGQREGSRALASGGKEADGLWRQIQK